jgi:hypothetical protein
VREESSEWVMADLYGHEAGNGGHRQRMPTTHPELLYSELRCRFDDQRHIWRVFDLEVEGRPVSFGLFQDGK